MSIETIKSRKIYVVFNIGCRPEIGVVRIGLETKISNTLKTEGLGRRKRNFNPINEDRTNVIMVIK